VIPNVGATLLGVVGELVTGTAGANPSMVNGLVSLDLKNFSRSQNKSIEIRIWLLGSHRVKK